MAAQYNLEQISGEAYIGADRIVIESPANAPPSVTIIRSKRMNIDGELITKPLPHKIIPLVYEQATPEDPPVNLMTQVPLIDPTTGTPTGTSMTYAGLFAAVYSFFVHAESLP